MVSTPTGVARGRRGKTQTRKLRRRLIEIADDADESDSADKNDTAKDKLSESHEEESSISTVTPPERYSLRSHSRLENSADASAFYKSVLTPSRFKVRSAKLHGNSMYRTPKLKSSGTVKVYKIQSGKRTPAVFTTVWKAQVQNIIKRTWKVCYLSSMMGFHYSKKNLKLAYIRTLKIRILDVYASYCLTVEVTPSSFLNQNPKRTDSIFIKVTSLSPSEIEDEEDRWITVYEALLVRTEGKQSVAMSGIDWFPIMLYSGSEVIHSAVIKWLQASFGCYITPKGLTAASVIWLSAMWSSGRCTNPQHQNPEMRHLVFRYHVKPVMSMKFDPLTSKGLLIKLRVKASAIIKLWSRIKGAKDKGELHSEDVGRFHKAIECLMEKLTHLPNSLLNLIEVQTTCNSISRAGKIRLSCETSFNSLLQHLVEMFHQTCHFKNIDYGYDEDIPEEEQSIEEEEE